MAGRGKEAAVVRVILIAWIGVLGLTVGPRQALLAQQTPAGTPAAAEARPVRPRTALQQGVDLYLKGEYEAAEPMLRAAQAGRAQLHPSEQARLDDYLRKNSEALQARFQALEQLSQADQAIQAGRYQEAEPLLKALRSNKYLNAKERQMVHNLSETYRQKNPSRSWFSGSFISRWTSSGSSSPTKPDPDLLLAEARKALERHDYDTAEALARESEKAGYHAIFPWSDTPAKVLRDVQAARSKSPAHLAGQPLVADNQGEILPMPKLVEDGQARPQVSPAAPMKPSMAESPASEPASPSAPGQKAGSARELLRQAHAAVQAGELDKARQLVRQAEATGTRIPWWEEHTPEKIKAAIARAEQGRKQPDAAQRHPSATEAKALVRNARKALEENNLELAEDLAKQARLAQEAKWGLFEDTPDKVLADVAKARHSANSERAAAILAEARKLLEQGQLDEAERLTYQAEALRSHYPIWYRGERPDKLRAEISAKRKQVARPNLPPLLDPVVKKDETGKPASPVATARGDSPLYTPSRTDEQDPRRQQALQMLAEARKQINNGDLIAALNLAARVKSMNLPFYPGEESPETIVAAVRAIQSGQAARTNPETAEAVRRQALQHLADARLALKEDRLLDALESVRQAQQCQAVFQPQDDLPENVLDDLRKAAQEQVAKYSAAAQTLAQHKRYQDADRYWSYVHQVASAFGMDVSRIESQWNHCRQLAAGEVTPASQTVPSEALPGDEERQGYAILAQAREQLKRGELIEARKLAESLYTGPFALKEEARRLLAQIDDAEYRQAVKRSELLYEQAVRAYQRKDYQVAASYLQSLDLKLLDDRRRAHAQEMLSSKPVLAREVAAAALQEAPSSAQPPAGSQTPDQPGDSSLLAEVRKRQEILLQKLRDEQLQSEREAARLANQGDYLGAIKRLDAALAALRESELDSELTSAMIRRLEQRKKQYSTMHEQVAFAELQKDKMNAASDVAKRKYLFEEHKREQVNEYLRQYNALYKQGKYKEAAVLALKAKEIDPDNPAAEIALFKADVMRNLASEEQIRLARSNAVSDALVDVARSATPLPESEMPVSYGDKAQWFNISEKRKGKVALSVKPLSPEDKEVANKLNTIISVDFRDKPLLEVLDELREMTGINIVPDRQYIEMDGIQLDQRVTLPLDRVPVKTALRLILHNARLTYVIQDGVVLVTTPAGEKGKMTRKVYPVADLIVPLEPEGLSDPIAQMGNSAGQQTPPGAFTVKYHNSPGDMFPGSLADGSSPAGTPKGHSANKRSMVEVLIQLIQNTIEPGSWDVMGGSGHIEYYPIGMSLVVSQTPDIQEQVQLLLDRLRELQQVQVTVEVRFITLSENFFERIGIDFDFQINDNQTRFSKQVAANAFAPANVPNEPSHLDNVIVGLTPTGVFTNDLDIPINVSSFERAALPSGFAGFPGQPGGNGGIDMGIAFLSSIEAFLFIEAAQGDIRSNILTAPKLTLFNGATASVTSSLTQFLVLQVIPVRDFFTGLITFLPVNTPVPSQTTLTVSAVVSADRRYVTLILTPVITRVVGTQTFTPIPGVTLQQPNFEFLQVATAVSVPDGGTILMGGLKNMSEQRLEFGPPILSKLPYINRLFRNQSFGREARTLMIMVTPRIIIPEEEEEKLGQTFAF
jgi:type II secretory pathway component GspD/PulD (secretin)